MKNNTSFDWHIYIFHIWNMQRCKHWSSKFTFPQVSSPCVLPHPRHSASVKFTSCFSKWEFSKWEDLRTKFLDNATKIILVKQTAFCTLEPGESQPKKQSSTQNFRQATNAANQTMFIFFLWFGTHCNNRSQLSEESYTVKSDHVASQTGKTALNSSKWQIALKI